MTLRNRLGPHMDDILCERGNTEQKECEGDKGQLVTVPPRNSTTQEIIKFPKNSEMESCEVCGGSFKKGRGLKIHQGKTKCKSVLENRKCKSKEGGPQESHHSGTTNSTFLDRPTQFLSEASKGGLKDSKDDQARETCKKSEGKKKILGVRRNIGKKNKGKVESSSVDIRNFIVKGERKGTGVSGKIFNQPIKQKSQDKRSDSANQNNKSFDDIYKKLSLELNKGNRDDILTRHYIPMSREDYRSLTGKNWLNDNVINEYLHLVNERNKNEKLTKVSTLDSFAFKMLESNFEYGYDRIKNQIKEDLTESDIVLVPIHKDDHWTLISVVIRERKIEYYDSILSTRHYSNAPKVFRNFFNRYFAEKNKDAGFKVDIRKDAPVQGNGHDCGIFVCLEAEEIARVGYVRKQFDTSNARRKIMINIFKGNLNRYEQNNLEDFLAKASQRKENENVVRETQSNKFFKNSVKSGFHKKSAKNKEVIEKSKKAPINWPKANSKDWELLDKDLTALLKIKYLTAEKKSESHPIIIYEMCRERFGVREKNGGNKKCGPSKRQLKCAKLRREINELKNAYKVASASEKEAIQEVNSAKLRQLRLAKRAESIRKHRKKFSANCKQFLNQPYKFSREVIAPKPKGRLESSKEEIEAHLKKAHSNQGSPDDRQLLEDLHQFSEPEYRFEDEVPSFKEFMLKLRKTRSKSAPGPNGVPYLVYKRCPGVARELWLYIKELWKRNIISNSWREAEGVFIPKEEGAKTVDKFRTISLLNVEGKLFFSLKADRITSFLLKNSLIDPSIQKGGIPGISGCLEHTSLVSQAIREAKKEKKNLVVTWLDIANAYGSIPHDVIKHALENAHLPTRARDLIANYYKDLRIRFTTKDCTTDWQKVEKGIITGCTLSVVLFSLTMSWLVQSVKNETKGPKTSSGQRQVNSRLFMDDINTMTETVPQTNHLVTKLSQKMKWAGLDFRLVKCRSLVIYKGVVQNREIKIDGVAMQSLKDIPAKYLGKKYSQDLQEREQIKQVEEQLKYDLKKIDKCKLPGRYKCWMVQHMLKPRIMWPLSIYNVPLSKVEDMQKKITKSLKRWLKIPNSLSNTCFYSTTSRLRLPYSSIVEEFKLTKARNLLIFEDSVDPCISNANITVDGGRKADTPAEVKQAKSRLQMQEIIGIPNKGREGLGMRGRQYYSKSTKKGKRDLVVQEIRNKEEEIRKANMTSFSKQGAQLRWEVPQKYLKQNEIIKTSGARISFLIKSVYDLLPTPANKNKWFKTEDKCKLCGEEGTLQHILAGCKVALHQGRYKWRHDKVLKKIAESIEKRIKINNNARVEIETGVQFIREGEKKKEEAKTVRGNYFSIAKDWEMSTDLENCLKIPKEVTFTNLRPDIILISRSTKQFGMVELTVPSEERVEVSGELKRLKYEEIAQDARLNGWGVRVWAVEVGCRGFPASSMASFLREIGYQGAQKKKTLEVIGKEAENASHSLWKASFFEKWGNK